MSIEWTTEDEHRYEQAREVLLDQGEPAEEADQHAMEMIQRQKQRRVRSARDHHPAIKRHAVESR